MPRGLGLVYALDFAILRGQAVVRGLRGWQTVDKQESGSVVGCERTGACQRVDNVRPGALQPHGQIPKVDVGDSSNHED
jgi:hypothetical protein